MRSYRFRQSTTAGMASLLMATFAGIFMGIQPTHGSEKLSADRLLKMADEVRNPSETFKMKIAVKTSSTDQTFEVFLKGKEKTLIVVKSPAKDRGRNMLMG